MKGKLRAVLIIVVVLIVVVLIAPFLIPVNQFRPTIEEKASAALGRKVQIGNLSLSLLSGSLSAEQLSIGDDPKFESSPFLTAKALKVGVEMMPLILSKTLNVTGITIDSPQVTLIRDAAGRWNYSSLGAGNASTPSAGSSNPVAAFSVKKLELKDGSIVIGSTNSKKRSTYDHVNVTASDFSMASKFPVTVAADLPKGGKFKLDGDVGPLDQSDTALTPVDAKLTVNDLDLASTGILDPSLGLGGVLDLDGTLASQKGEAETKGTAKLSKALLIAGGSPASVPVTVDFDTSYDLRKFTGILRPSVLKIGSAAAHLSGTYENAGDATSLNIQLTAKDMPAKDLEAFLPALDITLPKGSALQAGTLNANLHAVGPTDKLVTTGDIGLFNGKLSGFDLGSKMSAVSALTGVKTGKDLEIEKLTSNVRMAPDGMQASNFLVVVPSIGSLAGDGTIDAKNNMEFKMAATLTTAQATLASPVSGAAGILGKVTGGGSGCAKGTTVPFRIQGTTSEPKFMPDVGGLAKGMLKSQLGCAGSTVASPAEKIPAGNAVQAIGGLFHKKKSQ